MAEAKAIITEDAVEDYIRCPLRYAFIWHYGIDPEEPFSKFRWLLRSALSIVYKCQHEGHMSTDVLLKQTKAIAKAAGPAWPHLWGIILKHAARIANWNVIAFSIPTAQRTGHVLFSGVIDLAVSEPGRLRLVHLHAYSSKTADLSAKLLTDCVRTGFSRSVLAKAQATNTAVYWESMYLSGSSICFTPAEPLTDIRPFLSSIGRGITAQAFYPVGHASSCHACYFRPVCDQKWCAVERLRTPLQTQKDILSELKR